MLPYSLALGIGYDEFWALNPRKLNVILEGFKLKRQMRDEEAWMLGGYVFQAVSISLGNAFRKKNQKAESYFEVLDKPFLKNAEEGQEISEKTKQKYIDALMAGLHTMKNNFELNHGK